MDDAPSEISNALENELLEESALEEEHVKSKSSLWSRGKKLRIGLIVIGIAQIAYGMIIFFAEIDFYFRIDRFNYSNISLFTSLTTPFLQAVIGATIIWIAQKCVQD